MQSKAKLLKNVFNSILFALITIGVSTFSFAEGTPQAMPNPANGVGMNILNGFGLTIGPYRGCAAEQRVRFDIEDHTTENLYFGGQFRNYSNTGSPATRNDVYIRIVDGLGMEVELGSHTDCRASKAYNRKLSDRRAKASAAYIKTKITNPERIYGKGYGEEFLLNGCECEGSVKSDCSEEEHEKNRRTEFKVLKTGAEDLKVINTSSDSFNN